MIISIIVAAANNNAIGKNNALPWHLKGDLQYFKRLTTNHCIIMGRNTFESIGKPLPNRTNIVLSSDKAFAAEGVVVRHTLQDALDYCTRWAQHEVFIIGGAQLYKQSIDLAHKIYLTKVDTEVKDADAFFDSIDSKKWELTAAERHGKDEHNDHDYIFEQYQLSKGEPIVYR
jgi:dihydrofolate reductase